MSYDDILFWKDEIDEMTRMGYPLESINKAKERLAEHKRKYREYLKNRNNDRYRDYKNGHVVNHGGEYDSIWVKVFFPGERWTPEEVEEFREENWKRCRYSAYDCTGDIFTWAIDCFNVPSGVICYIREGMDV